MKKSVFSLSGEERFCRIRKTLFFLAKKGGKKYD